jgi:hypothetical protein
MVLPSSRWCYRVKEKNFNKVFAYQKKTLDIRSGKGAAGEKIFCTE